MYQKRLSRSEMVMWEKGRVAEPASSASDEEINKKYAQSEMRIITESNREQLPNFVSACERPGWINLKPFYQRRSRWNDQQRSKLIESFILNVPVPPCFMYESEYARYEVMDGQQRITSILDFYNNKFRLKGLEQWPELNGRKYEDLPVEIKRGLDRRSISYIVLLKESAKTTEEELLLRQQVFERLNTGGESLENQEIRHCIYHNEFDNLLLELSKSDLLRDAWGLPRYTEEEDRDSSLAPNKPHYRKMRDVEFVLRFFALRHIEKYRGGMASFLDEYMVKTRNFDVQDISFLRELFNNTISLAHDVYGDNLFKPWDAEKNVWKSSPSLAYADATLVSLSGFIHERDRLISRRREIIDATKKLLQDDVEKVFSGKGNTRDAVTARIERFSAMIIDALG